MTDAFEILVVRHGPTVANQDARYMGWLDPDLNLDQPSLSRLVHLKGEINLLGPHRLLCSPLRRAHETAELISTSSEAEVDPRLREWGLGEWEGMRHERVQQVYPAWFDAQGIWDPRITPPGGETLQTVELRVRSFLASVWDSRRIGQASVVVSHNGIIRIMRMISGQIPVESLFDTEEPSLSIETIAFATPISHGG